MTQTYVLSYSYIISVRKTFRLWQKCTQKVMVDCVGKVMRQERKEEKAENAIFTAVNALLVLYLCENRIQRFGAIIFEKVYLNQHMQKTLNDGKIVFIKV